MRLPRENVSNTGFWTSAAVVASSVLITLIALEVFFRIEEGNRLDPDLATRLPLPQVGQRTPGIPRILAIGDSFTRGVWLPPEKAYPAQLQTDLEQHGLRVEVLNLGWPGTNTLDQLELAREVLPQYEPDLVLLGFYANDIQKSWAEIVDYEANADETSGTRARLWGLRNQSYLFRFLRPRMIQALYNLGMSPPRSVRYATQIDSQYAENGDGFQRCQVALRALQALCDASGTRLLVLVIPAMESFDENYPFPSYHGAVATFCRQAGIGVVDLLPAFHGMKPLGLRVSLLDNHPNEKAYRTLAEAVGQELRSNGWLSKS